MEGEKKIKRKEEEAREEEGRREGRGETEREINTVFKLLLF